MYGFVMRPEHMAPTPTRTRREGSARLAFERVGSRTVVRTALAHSPLRLLTPRNHGHAAWVYTSSLGGGLVDGDHLHVDLEVAPGASALLSSQGFTRVYRSPRGCRNELEARVGEGGLLALVPDPPCASRTPAIRSARTSNSRRTPRSC
jgi:urease accessory protein